MTKIILIALGGIEMLYNGRDLNALVHVLALIGSCLFGTFIVYSLFKTL